MWEYHVFYLCGNIDNYRNQLNEASKGGWELVSVASDGLGTVVYLKRPKQRNKENVREMADGGGPGDRPDRIDWDTSLDPTSK